MSNFLTYSLISILDFIGIFLFIFPLFRIDVKGYFLRILIISTMISYVDYTLRECMNLDVIAPLVHIFMLIILIWQLLRVQVTYAIVMAIVGYFTQGLLQVFLTLSFTTIENAQEHEYISYSIQVGTAILMFVLGRLIKKMNWGVTFVSDDEFEKISFSKPNLILFSITFVVLVVGMVGFVIAFKNPIYLHIFLISFFICVLGILYAIIKKEGSED